jgi:TPR repeat protein
MLGLGVQVDIPKALSHFEVTLPKNDSRSINAIGYIYFKAPDIFEKDPALTNPYGSIRKDLKKAKQYFERASIKGNVNALYNMGCFYLTSSSSKALKSSNSTFSFTQAYDYFRQAAEKGHTFSAYNLAIMHFLGIGTFESCHIAQTFLKHVADVGQNTQELKTAYSLVLDNRPREAAMLYMELAE